MCSRKNVRPMRCMSAYQVVMLVHLLKIYIQIQTHTKKKLVQISEWWIYKSLSKLPVTLPAFIKQWISTNNGPLLWGSIFTTYLAFALVTGCSVSSDAKKISPKLPLPTHGMESIIYCCYYCIENNRFTKNELTDRFATAPFLRTQVG